MVLNFLAGGAAVNVLARHAGADVICVDIGVNADLEHPDLVSRKVRKGTANMAKGAAMTRDEAVQAILAGAEVVSAEVAKGTQLFVTGEMGIGNTTASAAVMCALTGTAPASAVGRGTGIDDAGLQRKAAVVSQALSVNAPDENDALDVLSKVGGLEIAGLTGVILAAAAHGCPVVVDGFISTAAALVARQLAPVSTAYMIASHTSHESGHAALLRELGLKPMLDLDMRLGEGTGGVLSLHLIDAACLLLNEMATFASAGISDGTNKALNADADAGKVDVADSDVTGASAIQGESIPMSVLVTGGARSGKSSFAERLCMQRSSEAWYVATAQAYDDEMRERIRLHQNQRDEAGYLWHTVEEPLALPAIDNTYGRGPYRYVSSDHSGRLSDALVVQCAA